MARFIYSYAWIVPLVTTALCALLAGRAVARVLEAQLPPHEPLLRQAPVQRPAPPTPRQADRVTSRNIFCSGCQPEAPAGQAARAADPAPFGPAPTPLDLRLLATLVGQDQAGAPVASYALVRRGRAGRAQMVAVGQLLRGDAVVTAIEPRRVLLRRGGQLEFLALEPRQRSTPRPPSPRRPAPRARRRAPHPRAGVVLRGIRAAGPRKWEIRRSVVQQVMLNPTLLRGSARVSAEVRGGRQVGFRVHRMPPGGIYSRLGLHNGDVIIAVNGHPVTTPDRALEAYTKLRTASRLVLTLTRGGRRLTHEYVVR